MATNIPHYSINDDDRIGNTLKPSMEQNKKTHSPIFKPRGMLQMAHLDTKLGNHFKRHKHYYGRYGMPLSLGIMSKMLSSPIGKKRFKGFDKEYEKHFEKATKPMISKNIDDLSGEGLMDDIKDKYGETKTNVKERYDRTKAKVKAHFDEHGDKYKKYGIPIATATALALAGTYAYTRQPTEDISSGFVGFDDEGEMEDIDLGDGGDDAPRGAGDMSMFRTPDGIFQTQDGITKKIKRKSVSQYLYDDLDEDEQRSILEQEDSDRYVENPDRTWETRLEKLTRINYEKERGLYDTRKIMEQEERDILRFGTLEDAEALVEDSEGTAVYKSYDQQGNLTPYGRLREETEILGGLSSINQYAPEFLRRDEVNRLYRNRATRDRGAELFAQIDKPTERLRDGTASGGDFVPVRRTPEGFVWDTHFNNGILASQRVAEIDQGDTPEINLDDEEEEQYDIGRVARDMGRGALRLQDQERQNVRQNLRFDVQELDDTSDRDLARLDEIESGIPSSVFPRFTLPRTIQESDERLIMFEEADAQEVEAIVPVVDVTPRNIQSIDLDDIDEGSVIDLSQMRSIEQGERQSLIMDMVETSPIPIAQMNQTEYQGMLDGLTMMPVGSVTQNQETEDLRDLEEFQIQQAYTQGETLPFDDVSNAPTPQLLLDSMSFSRREPLDEFNEGEELRAGLQDLKVRLTRERNPDQRAGIQEAIDNIEENPRFQEFQEVGSFMSEIGKRNKLFERRSGSTAPLVLEDAGRITTSDRGDRRVIDKVRGEDTSGRKSSVATERMGRPIVLDKFMKTTRREGDDQLLLPLMLPNSKQGSIGGKFKEPKTRPIDPLPQITDVSGGKSSVANFFFGKSKGKGSKGGSKKKK